MAPVELDQPEPSETAPPSAEPPPFASRALLWSGVAGACALGVAAGLWARPGLAERGLAVPAPEKPAAEAAEPRLQIIVDDTPAPLGAPIEVLPPLPSPAPYTPPPRQIVAEPAPRQPPSGLMRAGGVPEPEAAPADEPLETPRRALRLPHFDFGGTFGKLKRLVSNTDAQEAEAAQARADAEAEARLAEEARIAAEAKAAEHARLAAAKAEQAKLAHEKNLAEAKAAELKAAELAESRRQAKLEAAREAAEDRRRAEIRQAKLESEAVARRKAERLEEARLEKARLEKAEARRAEKARIARLEDAKAEKAEAARLEKAKLEKAKLAKAEKARIEKARLEKERKAAERLRIAKAEKAAEKARIEKIRLAAVQTEKLQAAKRAEKLKAEKAKAAQAQVRLAASATPAPKKNRCALPDIGEALVCADPALSAADRRMVRAYREAQAAGVPEWRLQEQQNRWRAARTAAAREAPWQVREVYLARIAELNDMAASGEAN